MAHFRGYILIACEFANKFCEHCYRFPSGNWDNWLDGYDGYSSRLI